MVLSIRTQFSTLVTLMGVACLLWPHPVTGHARLWEPAGRSTLWRRGFQAPINYDDNQLFCGGFYHQVNLGYKCGVCGDPYDATVKDNEAGGKYAQGILAATYTQGQEVTFQVDVTANHKGFFEFKLCPVNDPKKDVVTPECLAAHPVELADGSGNQYKLTYSGTKIFDVTVRLPADLTCDFCVLQFRYHTGNSWGTDPDGTSCLGCGKQEEFYACSDIRILPGSGQTSSSGSTSAGSGSTSAGSGSTSGLGSTTSNFVPTSISTTNTESGSTTGSVSTSGPSSTTSGSGSTDSGSSSSSGTDNNPYGSGLVCDATQPVPGLKQWCQMNCQMGYCPSSHCYCKTVSSEGSTHLGCRAVEIFAGLPGYNQWCAANCPAGNCPASICTCN